MMIKGLPERIKQLRVSRGYSQKEMANKLQISASIVSGYETGERTPSLEVLLDIAYLFNCSTDYLLGKATNFPPSVISIEGLTPDQGKAIMNLIDSMRSK